jgi:hypothetical protein
MSKETADFKSLFQKLPGSMIKITSNLSQGTWHMDGKSNPKTSEYEERMLITSGRYKRTCRDSARSKRTPGREESQITELF